MKNVAKVLSSDTLFRNSVYLMLSTGTMAAFGFVFWLMVAHFYRTDQVGVASTLISSMNFIAYFSLFGFNSTFVRFLSHSKDRNVHIDTGLVIVAGGALLTSGLFVIVGPHFAQKLELLHHTTAFGIAFMLMSIGAAVNLATDSVFVAYRSAGYNFFIDGVFASSVQLVLPILLVSLGAFGIYAAQGVAASVAMGLSIFCLVKKFGYRPHLTVNRQVLREVVHYSSSNYIANLLATLPTIIIPIIILSKLGAAPAGYYYLAYMMANVLFTAAYAVSQSLFAEGSYGERQLHALTKRAGLFLAAIMVPASLLLAVLGPFVLRIFGDGYSNNAGLALSVLALSGPFLAASALGSVILRVTKQLRALLFINLTYAAIVCSLAILWVHRGLTWVAGACLVGQIVCALLLFVVLGLQSRRFRAYARSSA